LSSFDGAITRAGRVYFRGALAGAGITQQNDEGYWVETASGMQMFMREGQPEPGLPGVALTSIQGWLNDAGQFVFVAELWGPGIDYFNNDTLWVRDQKGAMTLLLREGDTTDIGGVSKVIAQVSPQPLNERGEIAVGVRFDDRTYAILDFTLPSAIAGDADNNNIVDYRDFEVLHAHFGKAGVDRTNGDFNYDGVVNFQDFQILERHIGSGLDGVPAAMTPQQQAEWAAFAATVPEPGAFSGMAALVLMQLRRRMAR
jgi:hypothetical protein